MKAQQFSSTLSSTHELIDRCRSKHREGTAGEETRQDRSFRLRRMDGVLKEFSDRADEAEKRLEYLEKAISSGSNGQSNQTSMLTQRYVEELQALRNVLVSAKEDQEMLEGRVIELEKMNSKLEYQVKHLKRAVVEGDAKLSCN